MKKRGLLQIVCMLIMMSVLVAGSDFTAYAKEREVGLPEAKEREVGLPEAKEREAGLLDAKEREAGLSDAKAAVEQLIEEHKDQTPAVSVTVFEKDRDICTVIYGEADRESHIAADADTVYEWGSVSKMLVWVSAMQLYEQGKLDLNADIRTYLPEDFSKKLFFKQPVTMLNLMNHNAGFQDAMWPMETSNLDELKPLDVALLDTAPAQVRKPGTVVAYSNWGAALAGYVVECVSGMPFADYVREYIFEPLHMEHTYMRPEVSDHAWAAEQRTRIHCYAASSGGLRELGECRAYIHLYPAGAAGGTISDMAAFAKAFLCDSAECPLFEKPDTLDLMLSPSLCYADGEPRICHGLFVQEYGASLVGHGGNTSGFSSLLLLDPEGKTGFVMMTNTAGDRIYKSELPLRLYGECDFVPEDTSGRAYDFSGMYYIGGTACAGPAKLVDFLQGSMNLKKKNGAYENNAGIVSIVPLADGTAKVELITGAVYRYHIKTDDKGNVVQLQHRTVDFEKRGKAEIGAGYLMVVLPGGSFAVLMVLLLLHLISVKKSREEGCPGFRTVEIVVGADALLTGVVLFGMTQMTLLNRSGMVLPCAALIVLQGLMILGILFCHITKKKPGGRARVGLMLETVCGLILIVGICYWRFYQFWGY